MKTICFYFQIHQPFRLKRYRFFDIGNDHYYYDDFANDDIITRIAQRSYLPANATLLEMIKNANPTKEYLSLKSLETYEKMADGKATKIIVPSELQNMASVLTSAREILIDDAEKEVETLIKGKK